MGKGVEKRALAFENFDQAIAEAKRLLDGGYEKRGKWNLAQCCRHLDDWLKFPMDGFPKAAAPIRLMLWLMKISIGKSQLKKVLDDGFNAGLPTMPATVYEEADAAADAEAFEALEQTVHRFVESNSPIHPSPLYGEMDRATATKLQLRHFEHHLGFLVPK